ncbi:PLP-dependent aminotransferase family protein [Hyphomicrobium sp.]|uniref:aminotransferase-like domain-containing protein n=1 Tax=Hyphomicrobium sp. TaxID=82 RepID=UPI00356550A6
MDAIDWVPDLSTREKPRYLAIADAIEEEIRLGRLGPSDRLPPQRELARRLNIDFTTVARGYVEAQKRGLIESRVGQGTFVAYVERRGRKAAAPREDLVDLTMNLPPEPDDPVLIDRMQSGIEWISQDIVALLRYQNFGGSRIAKEAATNWLGRRALVPSHDRLFITPGAHPAMLGIFSTIAKPGDVVVCEAITYPGMKAIAAQLGLRLIGIAMDDEGIDAAALEEACAKHKPKALYLNPTLQNPTTITISEQRRSQIAAVARRYRLPIVEDDAYGFIAPNAPPPFAALVPELTWHIAGLAKCLGAGLRMAYVIAPDIKSSWSVSSAIRSATVMASPLTVALATRWIEDGTADAILKSIRTATQARQELAAEILQPGSFRADLLSFNIWVNLPKPWTRSAFIGQTARSALIGIVASDAFCVGIEPPEAVRICLGGPLDYEGVRAALEYTAHALDQSPAMASNFL